jgi:Icc-related predicted phosphoesterase
MPKPLRVAAMADMHYGRHSGGQLRDPFCQASEEADVLLLCGDFTDYGLPEEAELIVRDLRDCVNIPVLGVLGNHDFESGQSDEVRRILGDGGIDILDGSSAEIGGVGFAGTAGFGGGFGKYALSPWGEAATKAYVQASVDEELKLESALARLSDMPRVVLLHYAPVKATVEGEPPEIWPFLGSDRLQEPLNRHEVTVAFHGHAHIGSLEAETTGGVPVFNVSIPLLRRAYPDRPPYRLFKVERKGAGDAQPKSVGSSKD